MYDDGVLEFGADHQFLYYDGLKIRLFSNSSKATYETINVIFAIVDRYLDKY